MLQFVRQDIEGMTSPQLYIKVPGVWTGGHEENLRFRSINCAHGSGASIWYAVAPEHSKQLRKVVQTECGVDIYEDEGRYFPSVKFLRSHGIPVMMGIQEPGDVVVLKGGTLGPFPRTWNQHILEFWSRNARAASNSIRTI